MRKHQQGSDAAKAFLYCLPWTVTTHCLLKNYQKVTTIQTIPSCPASALDLPSMSTKTLVVSVIAFAVLFAIVVGVGVGVHHRHERENRSNGISRNTNDQGLNETVPAVTNISYVTTHAHKLHTCPVRLSLLLNIRRFGCRHYALSISAAQGILTLVYYPMPLQPLRPTSSHSKALRVIPFLHLTTLPLQT